MPGNAGADLGMDQMPGGTSHLSTYVKITKQLITILKTVHFYCQLLINQYSSLYVSFSM